MREEVKWFAEQMENKLQENMQAFFRDSVRHFCERVCELVCGAGS